MKSLLLKILILAIFSYSCSVHNYINNAPITPAFTKDTSVKAQFHLSFTHLEANVAFTAYKHFCVGISGFYTSNPLSKHGLSGELYLFRYDKLAESKDGKTKIFVDYGLGYGLGKVNSSLSTDIFNSSINENASSNWNKLYAQSSIYFSNFKEKSYTSKGVSKKYTLKDHFGFGYRLNYLNFDNIQYSRDTKYYTNSNKLDYEISGSDIQKNKTGFINDCFIYYTRDRRRFTNTFQIGFSLPVGFNMKAYRTMSTPFYDVQNAAGPIFPTFFLNFSIGFVLNK